MSPVAISPLASYYHCDVIRYWAERTDTLPRLIYKHADRRYSPGMRTVGGINVLITRKISQTVWGARPPNASDALLTLNSHSSVS